MERHAIPQNIMEVEFKLFGSFSVRQFGYLAGGFILAAMFYFLKWPFLLKIFLMLFSALMGLFLAVVRINGQSSTTFVVNFIKAIFNSQSRIWKKKSVTPDVLKDTNYKRQSLDDQIVEKITKRNTSRIPLFAMSENKYQPGAEKPIVEDKFEEQRLRQIDQYYNFEINKLNQTDAGPAVQRNVVLPSLNPQPIYNPVVENPPAEGLAGNIKATDDKYQSIISNEGYTTFMRTVPEVRNDKKVLTEEKSTQDQDKMNKLKSDIAQLQTELGAMDGVKDSQQVEIKEKKISSGSSNNLNGLVVAKNGSAIRNAVVNIKNTGETLVRRLLTDNKGKFYLRNPLPNGTYYVDIVAEGFKFARYKVILEGGELYSFQFKSK